MSIQDRFEEQAVLEDRAERAERYADAMRKAIEALRSQQLFFVSGYSIARDEAIRILREALET